jgi:hypothetical protein
MEWLSLWISELNVLLPAIIISAIMWSVPGYLYLFNFLVVISTLEELETATNVSNVCVSVCLTLLMPCILNSWGFRISQWYDIGLDDWGFESQQGLEIFLFTTMSRPALGPTQPPIQWVPGALSLGVKQLGCEVDHTPLSSAEVKEWIELYLHSPICVHGMVLS